MFHFNNNLFFMNTKQIHLHQAILMAFLLLCSTWAFAQKPKGTTTHTAPTTAATTIPEPDYDEAKWMPSIKGAVHQTVAAMPGSDKVITGYEYCTHNRSSDPSQLIITLKITWTQGGISQRLEGTLHLTDIECKGTFTPETPILVVETPKTSKAGKGQQSLPKTKSPSPITLTPCGQSTSRTGDGIGLGKRCAC
jgi:hypothetical protein